jgi:hypothetical protein
VNRRVVLLASVALLLGVVLLLDQSRSPTPPPAEPSAAADQGQPVDGASTPLNPLDALDAAGFTATLASPLFDPGRAPRPQDLPAEPALPAAPMPETPVVAVGPNADDFELVAIAASASGRVAAVRSAATGEVLYLREGQMLDVWRVLSLGDRSIVIGTEESNVKLSLFDDEQATEPPTPASEAMPQPQDAPPEELPAIEMHDGTSDHLPLPPQDF